MPEAAIRPLGPEDAAAWRALRLEALQLHPDAFGAALEDEAALDLAAFARRLSPAPPSVVLGAFDPAGELLGTVGLAAQHGLKERHKALVWGMHVRPEARGHGIGRALLEAVAAHARAAGLAQLQLGVGTGNAAARRLYESAGYVVFGVERDALRPAPGRSIDEELRVLRL